ncbi:restriction endonuclease subunit S [Treponema porcinum]|uniref:restriction endonuclease subunit S n=1 Tax=Treponema porcinum TaxID=261392 RepID=UPI002356476A|nr:restriction endonuclease subunit S [Treponema porcinum]MCI6480694.1 restriction endonuclease subunit S [Treponema porcinum]
MEEWKECKLSDICDYGKDRIEVSSLDNSNYISTENMLPNRAGITTATTLPTGEYTPSFEIDDTLVSNIRPYFKKIWKATFSGGCSADVLVFKAKENVSKEYLYYVLADDEFFKYSMTTSKGTKMPRGDKTSIMNYPVKLPPLPTQQKIARILSSLDDKIELNNKINTNLEQQAQALFKNWFVDFEPFGGKMPEGWKVGKLSDVAEITMGQSPDGKSYNEDGIGTVFYQGRAEFGTRFPTRRLFTTDPKRIAKKFDTLMSVRAPVGDTNIANEDCCIGRGLAAIHSKDGHQSFVHYAVLSLRPQLDVFNGEGTVFGCINRDALNNMEIVITAQNELDKFEQIVASLDVDIYNRSEENDRLKNIRDTLLPKLMNGEILLN